MRPRLRLFAWRLIASWRLWKAVHWRYKIRVFSQLTRFFLQRYGVWSHSRECFFTLKLLILGTKPGGVEPLGWNDEDEAVW